jgi:chitin synthase
MFRPGYVGIHGWMFNVTRANAVNGVNFQTLASQLSGQDITGLFDNSDLQPAQCRSRTDRYATVSLCANSSSPTAACTLAKPEPAYLTSLGLVNSTKRVGFSWEQIERIPNYMVVDGAVCNLNPYISAFPTPLNDTADSVIRAVLQNSTSSGGKDGTRLFYTRTTSKDAAECIKRRYKAGSIDKITPGCFASQLFLYVSLGVIMAVILARFFMALFFSWFLSAKLVQPPKNLKRHAVSPAVMPAGAVKSVNNSSGAAPWVASATAAHRANTVKRVKGSKKATEEKAGVNGKAVGPSLVDQNGMLSMAAIGAELFCVCLVTCYSEGLDSIKTTLDSIAGTDYADSRKLLFVVCDGMITGSGEKMSTPDICVSLLDADERFDNPQPMSYLAVAAGRKQHNQAMVYAGHYTQVKGHRTPCVIVVKTGTPEEARDAKPGNRGKRDSQMVLMNFFSRVT